MIGVLCEWKVSWPKAVLVGLVAGLKLLAMERTFDSCLMVLDFENSFIVMVDWYSLSYKHSANNEFKYKIN